jgi:hypothetical protein
MEGPWRAYPEHLDFLYIHHHLTPVKQPHVQFDFFRNHCLLTADESVLQIYMKLFWTWLDLIYGLPAPDALEIPNHDPNETPPHK